MYLPSPNSETEIAVCHCLWFRLESMAVADENVVFLNQIYTCLTYVCIIFIQYTSYSEVIE